MADREVQKGMWPQVVGAMAGLAALVAATIPALAFDKVTFGLNWLADPEAGGYYQAVVDGTYSNYGLEVTILPGRPQSNGGILLVAGKIDFFQGGDLLGNFLAEERNIPIVAVAADFQRDPQIFMSHPGVGLDKWTDLPNAATAYVSAGGLYSFYAWMAKAWGFTHANVKPYDFDSAPFIINRHSIQEGYLTSEPYAVAQHGHFKPNVFLLADYGYSTYSSLIEARRDTVETKSRPGAALRRRVGDRLVSLPLRRQCQSQCGDQTGQPRNDRRPDRLLGRQAQGRWRRRFGRRPEARHRRHDRRARQGLLRRDGQVRDRQARHRL